MINFLIVVTDQGGPTPDSNKIIVRPIHIRLKTNRFSNISTQFSRKNVDLITVFGRKRYRYTIQVPTFILYVGSLVIFFFFLFVLPCGRVLAEVQRRLETTRSATINPSPRANDKNRSIILPYDAQFPVAYKAVVAKSYRVRFGGFFFFTLHSIAFSRLRTRLFRDTEPVSERFFFAPFSFFLVRTRGVSVPRNDSKTRAYLYIYIYAITDSAGSRAPHTFVRIRVHIYIYLWR